jgi:hypothetical protein
MVSESEEPLVVWWAPWSGWRSPEYEAKRYEGRVKESGVLLSVHCDTSDEITRAKEILKRTGAEDIASAGEEAVAATANIRDRRSM